MPQLFIPIYDKVIEWADHRHAIYYLVLVGIAEASIFPIPVALMLIPMILARKKQVWWLATLTTFSSVLGGIIGYLIGRFLFAQIGQPIIDVYHATDTFTEMAQWYEQYGIWLILLAGITPIPFKIFTLTSGVMQFTFIPFLLASIVGRGIQFYLIAVVLWWGGDRLEQSLRHWMEWIGWGLIVLAVMIYLYLQYY